MPRSNAVNESLRLAALHRYNLLDTPQEESFDRITRLAKSVLQTPIVLISLVDQNRQWFKSRQGLDVQETERSISFCSHAIQEDIPLIIPNALEHASFRENPLVVGAPRIRFYIGVQLKVGGHNIGTLCAMDTKPRQLSPEQVGMFSDLARLVVNEIELCHSAMTDSLTGIFTRCGFEVEITREYKRSQRYRRSLSLIAIDLDGFKKMNDRYGHLGGDCALKSVSNTIASTLRETDLLARWGGDELIVALPETGIGGARIMAERIRSKVEGQTIQFDSNNINMTISLGISEVDDADDAWAMVHGRADAALYEAKDGGRNMCVSNHKLATAAADGLFSSESWHVRSEISTLLKI